ncbi:MAG: T9SS type A sorting domain-containing protein, partial [Bacteroidetes bacterium]|nr:T9SS type A sorting domain-containing protein [Bacteroidota bacterium]
IIDYSGQVILDLNRSNSSVPLSIDVSELKSGMYFIQTVQSEINSRAKLIINK